MEPDKDSGGLSILNPSPTRLPGPPLLHELISRDQLYENSAVDFLSEKGERLSISYAELHAASDQLASRIADTLSSDPGGNDQDRLVVPLLIPQSPELYIALLAILKTGGAFCPLNLDAPAERVKFILKDVDAKLVLVSSDLAFKIPSTEGSCQVLLIDRFEPAINDQVSRLPPKVHRRPTKEDLAYVMYTSGSTGTPKGVGISHDAVTQSLLAHDRHIPTFRRFLQFAAPTFDVSVFDIFFPLFRGCTLVSCERSRMLTDLPGLLCTMDVDACELTPSVAGSLLRSRDRAPNLQLLLMIGEMLTEPLIREFGGSESQESILWGMYGPTEATIHCTLQPAFKKGSGRTCIGIPLETVSAFVVEYSIEDETSTEPQIVPAGQVGELAVGGFQLAQGYINRPEQTAATFIESAWGRLYRTGDKARILPDGTIECLGRINDSQVKLNGQRIELGEVEQAILRTDGCHGAVATVISNTLVAFAAVESPEGMYDRVLSNCKSWLPSFMIPADIKIVSSFPQLPSGKVDRKRLATEHEASLTDITDPEPQFQTELERHLCEVVRRLLGPHIMPKTQLSSVGLDSLVAIQYASALHDSGIFVGILDILESPTIVDLSRIVQNRTLTSGHHANINDCADDYLELFDQHSIHLRAILGTQIEEIDHISPCTPLQISMLIETLKDHRLYINQFELMFPPGVNALSVKTWIAHIAQRNEIFRTGFIHVDNTLHQVIWKQASDQINIVDRFSEVPASETEQFLQFPLKVEIMGPKAINESCKARFTLHHSIYDGWTTDLLIEDLSTLSSGGTLHERPQFSLASRHTASVSESQLMLAKEYWAEYLRGCSLSSVPNLRTVSVQDPQIMTDTSSIHVDPDEVIRRMRQSTLSPQVLFQASLAWLWAAVMGSDEIVLGSVSSGRSAPIVGVERIMGPFITTLPLRISLQRCRSIHELMQGIHVANRESLKHEVLSLSDVKKAAGLQQNTRLFDVIFVYQESLASRKQIPGGVREVWHKDAVESGLLVEILPLGDRYTCHMTWHSDVYSHDQIRTFAQHLDTLAKLFLHHMDEPLDTVPQYFPADSLSRYNVKPTNMDTPSSLSELVENTVLLHPSRDSLVFSRSINASSIEAETLTYQELNSGANQIARHLQQHGASPGDIIAIVMEKSTLLYRTILGILKAGCTYLPILPSTPIGRVELILQQASPSLCLVDDHAYRLYKDFSRTLLNLEDASLASYGTSNLNIQVDPSSLAYIIYTSGTTGTPKGVSVTNKNMLSNIEVLSRIYPHSPRARMLQACSQAFDVSVFEIFFTWANGMSLCSATNDTLFEDLERAVHMFGVTHLSMTVTVASLINPRNVPNVEFLVTSGEPMTDEVLDKWADTLFQGYGPSETTNICTVRKVARGDSSQFLGWSFENTSTFVCYPGTWELVPLGCIGELCFGGDQVAAGYLKLAETTAEKFFEHPEYGRLYRAGDLGRMLPDGSLIILGRIDTQIKLRGLRIELQETQSTVLGTGLARACVGMLINARGSETQQLALFYAPTDHASNFFRFLELTDSIRRSNTAIQQSLQDSLPDYMVPSFIFPVSTLPLTSSGKVDSGHLRSSASSLPDDFRNACSSISDYGQTEGEWTEAENLIAKTLVDVLNIDPCSIRRWAPFAALGIDSISSMPLARELQKVFGTRIPLSLVIQNPSIGRLAAAIASATNTSTNGQVTSRESDLLSESLIWTIQKRFTDQGKPASAVLPCTPLQEAMLAASLSEASSSYSNHMLFQLRIPSDTMSGLWAEMFRRHDILRTCFITTDDVKFPIVQAVLDNYQPAAILYEADGSSLETEVARHLSSLSGAVDSGEPPVSLAIIRTADAEYLSFACHHAVYDGISMRSLLSEVEALAQNEHLPTPPRFEAFLRTALALSPDVDDFWAQHLQEFRPLHLERTAVPNDDGEIELTTRASSLNLSTIEARLKDMGISLLSFCQATWSITVSLFQNNSDVCFGNVVSGRSIALDNIHSLVAPCFNTLPLRMNLRDYKSTLQLAKRFQSLNIDLLPYQFTGLRRIQSQLQTPSRLFDTLLIVQPQAEPLDESIWSLKEDSGAMDVPIVCELTPSKREDTLELQLHRQASQFSYPTLLFIRDVFQHVFQECLNYPSSHFLTSAIIPHEWQDQLASLTPMSSSTETPIMTPASSDYDVNWSPDELLVRSVLSKLTDIAEEKIERHMPIYRFGLDSIGAVQLASSLRQKNRIITAAAIMANPTLVGIASNMVTDGRDEETQVFDFEEFQKSVTPELLSIADLPRPFEAILPCSHVQQGMLSQFLTSEGRHYFNFSSWTLDANVDSDRIRQAWSRLTVCHPILRTGFIPVNHKDASFAMVEYPSGVIPIPVAIHHGPMDIRQWRTDSTQHALKMLHHPPWRVVLIDEGSERGTMHLAMHHALYDAHSLRILLHDLTHIMMSEDNDIGSTLQASLAHIIKPPTSLRDAEIFWKGQAEKLVVNSFPTLTPLRVERQKFSSLSKTCRAPPHSLRQSASEAGVTIQAALQGAWTRLLSAYHGEMSVTFGVVLDGRSTEEARRAVFPMISTLPILAQNSESNQELLQSMLQYNAAVRQFEQTPLSNIQRWVGRPDGSLFDTILVYQVADHQGHRLPCTVLDEVASVDYTVSLEVEETSDKLLFNLTFDESILPVEQATIMLRQFDHILVDLVTSPASSGNSVSSESPDICSILPPLHHELPSSVALLYQLVEQTVQQKPDKVALEFVDEIDNGIACRRWTYKELDVMGNNVANILVRNSVPPKSIVAICFDKCPEAYFSILGILKAGCAFLALDPSAPSSRQEFILRDSGATCLLVARGSSSNLEFKPSVPIHEIGCDTMSLRDGNPPNPALTISPSDTCYCLYTSGTTGTPKGCLISHDNAVQAMLAFKELFSGHWDVDSRWLQFASFHFDVSVLEQYWSWFVGITVVAAPRDLILSDLVRTISNLEITHIDLTPSLARLVHPDEVPSLCRGVFITGGEQLRQDVLDNWGPKEVIYNAYGPTEATIGVTMFQRVPVNGRSSNIGHLFPNVGGYVFQPGTESPVLRGGVGELCVSGRLVGKGYLNRPDLTEQRFPTLEVYNERVYRTGDLVRVLHDGTFDFLGRADDQVKLRGQRLEIGEINHAIKVGISQITDVATLVARHGNQDRDLLVSFVAPTSQTRTADGPCILSDRASLEITTMAKDVCRGRIPGYMVPTYILCITSIPLSANNKANFNELKRLFNELSPEQLRQISVGTATCHRALNSKEKQIANVLSTITGVELSSIGPSSTIFELGIDSITVVRVAKSLHGAGFPHVTPSLILKNAQISQLASILGHHKTSGVFSRVRQAKQSIRACSRKYLGLVCRTLDIAKDEIEYIAPCTPLQEGILTRMRTAGSHSAYFNDFCITLHPSVSANRLQAAWMRVVKSCSILRTAFVQTSEGHVQVALKGSPLRWSEVQVEGEEVQSYLAARYRTWVESNQHVMQYPVEVDYVKSCEGHVLALRLFHAVYDAHSFGLIMDKVLDEYDQTSGPGPSFLDVLPHGPLLTHSSSREFWESAFKGYHLQPIPVLTSNPSTSDISVSRIINSGNVESRRVALGVTHQTVFQAAWLAVLHQYFQAPPTIGVVFSGRSILFDGVEHVIGPMFNTLPFRVEASDITTWESLIRKVHDYNTSVLDFVHTPLRDIQKWCSSGRPLFDTLFTFDHDTSFENGEHSLWSSITSTAAADYPLALEIVLPRKGGLRANIVAQRGIADEESLSGLLDKFQQALVSLAASDDTTTLPVREGSGELADISLATYGDPSSWQRTAPSQRVYTSTFEWTDIAQKVRREIAQLAGLAEDEISETMSILELGLDSIDAIKLSTRLPKLGIQVTTSELMRKATIKSILSSQQANHSHASSSQTHDGQWDKSKSKLWRYLETIGVSLADVEDVLPPTPLQDTMVANMLLSDFQQYFNHDVLEIAPSTDIHRLKNAWATVYTNSPILRTSFEEVDDPNIPTAFCQVVRKSELQFSPTLLQLNSLDEVQPIIDQARYIAKEGNGRSGLFQIAFAETPTSRYAIISISHALYDGWSLDMLYGDVRDAYDGRYKTRRPYETYLSRVLSSPWVASRDFWTDLMQDVHPTLLSIRETTENSKPVVHRAELRSKLTFSDIKASCKAYGITPQALCQGSWAAVLATIATSLDITFGVVMSGRDTEEAQELLFPTMNTVPIRALLYGTVTEYLQSLQTTLSEVLEFQHVPLREVQKVSRNDSQTLFNTLFILQNLGQHREGADEPLMTSVQGSSAVEYPLCVEMELTGESAVWRIACDECLGSSNTASKILDDLDSVLQYLVGNPDAETIRFSPDTDEARICNLGPTTLHDESLLSHSISSGETPHDNDQEWLEQNSPIVHVLAKLSGVDTDAINPSDSIYHLGLDSISAMKASSMLRKVGIRISVRELLKATSIRQLVENNSNLDGQPHIPSVLDNSYLKEFDLPVLLDDIGMDLSAVEEVLPALPMQVHMLTVWQNTDGSLFFPTFKFKVTGQVSSEAIQGAWEVLAAELPIFRTHFISTGSASIPFLQVILRPEKINAFAKGMYETTDSNHWAFQTALTPFVSLSSHGSTPGETHVYLRIHHALYDGVSLPIIMGRFAELCIAEGRSSPRSLDSWRRFALDHTRYDVKNKAHQFWTSYLQGLPPVIQMNDCRNAVIQASHVEILQKDVVTDLGRLKLWGSTHGVTLQSLFFAAYAQISATIRKHSKDVATEDVVFGVYMANRASYPDLEEVMHPTLSILPLRVRSPTSRGIVSLAAEIQKDLYELNTFEHTTVGLWEIERWTGVKVDAFVNFLNLPDSSIQRQNVVLEETPTDQSSVSDEPSGLANPRGKWLSRNSVRDSYPDALDLEVAVRGETMDIGIFSASHVCSESQAEDMIGRLVHALEEAM